MCLADNKMTAIHHRRLLTAAILLVTLAHSTALKKQQNYLNEYRSMSEYDPNSLHGEGENLDLVKRDIENDEFNSTLTPPDTTTSSQPIIDECSLNLHNCQHVCIDTLASFECSCNSGYVINTANPSQCVDVDECALNSANYCEQICVNTPGSYECDCFSGYALDPLNPFNCDDVNECALNSANYCEQICENTPGSYECVCFPGYALDPLNPFNCDDVNECALNIAGCDQLCQNIPGNFRCSCNPGFLVNPNNPTQCDECGGDLMEPSGEITSAYYPGNYVNSIDCYWTITAAEGQRIELTIEDFILEYQSTCGWDYVEFFNLDSTPSAVYNGKHCGNVAPHNLSSAVGTSMVTIHFHSDYIITARGFRITYNIVDILPDDPLSSLRLYPFGEEQGDSDILSELHVITNRRRRRRDIFNTFARYRECQVVELNGLVGAQFFNKRHFKMHVCNNGMLTMTDAYRQHYPQLFDAYDWYSSQGMISPFWGRVDEASGALYHPDKEAHSYYQVYTSQDANQVNGVDSSTILQRATDDVNQPGFTATWVLVATWVNMMPDVGCRTSSIYQMLFPNSNYANSYCESITRDLKLNHFQAVFITDGVYTFVKFNYPENGLNWAIPGLVDNLLSSQYDQYYQGSLASAGYSAGDGTLQDDATFYNMEGYAKSFNIKNLDDDSGNTGREGEWLLQLEESDGVLNSLLGCVSYIADITPSLEAQRSYSALNPCPTTIWQAEWDTWFKRRSSNYDVFCYQSVFPLFEGYKQVCCYDYRYRIRAVGALSPTFGQLLTGPPYSGYVTNLDNPEAEDQGYIDCCVESPLCSLLYQIKPYSNGSGYRPPNLRFGFGDPHVITMDGQQYAFNGWGEYVYAEVDNEVQVQARTSRVPAANSTYLATYFSAFAFNKSGQTFEIRVKPTATSEGLLNSTIHDHCEIVYLNTTYDLTNITNVSSVFLPGYDAIFTRTDINITVLNTNGVAATIGIFKGTLSIALTVPSRFKNMTSGLVGHFNGDQSDDFTFSNGTILSVNSTEREIFPWGLSHSTTADSSLFSYPPGETWSSFNFPEQVPTFLDELDIPDEITDTCSGDPACIFDWFISGDADLGQSSLESVELDAAVSEQLANQAPAISGPVTVTVFPGLPFQVSVNASDANEDDTLTFSTDLPNDTYQFSLLSDANSASFNITLDPIQNFSIAVSDGRAGSSYTPIIEICDCNNGTCVEFSEQEAELLSSGDVVNKPCDCDDGYTGDLCDEEIDGCALSADPCFPGVECTDLPDGQNYSCGACPVGMFGDGFDCEDIDLCETANSTQNCILIPSTPNTTVSYTCSCRAGYLLQADNHTCEDINECNSTSTGCEQICINTPGSFVCSCSSGYSANSQNRTACQDIDECSVSNGDCEVNCTNSEGSFLCSCNEGFELINSTHCEDIDECNSNSTCHQSCLNTPGSFTCSCLPGFSVDSLDPTLCNDNDECDINNGDCDQTCTNTVGSYECSCLTGFQLAENSQTNCSDIDECSSGNGGCSDGCSNTDGSFVCSCLSGYILGQDSLTCEDINECEDSNACSHICNNTVGDFECSCPQGYILGNNNLTCEDVDECLVSNAGCSNFCNNTDGSFLCVCPIGYQLGTNGLTCNDIDECSSGNGSCSNGCNNTDGSFVCSCLSGYILGQDSLTCEDIDECADNNAGCSHICNNTVGGFECSCPQGYVLGNNNLTCEDVDECSVSDAGCSHLCNNTDGSFLCVCPIGYQLGTNGLTCNDIDECSSGNGSCSNGCNNTDGSFVCLCLSGYILGQDSLTCEDIDECADNNAGCSHICNNTVGGFECSCPQGYVLGNNNLTCEDVDECSVSDAGCSHFCNNTDGSFLCVCPIGYQLGTNGLTCNDIDECAQNLNDCSQICGNTNGSYLCSCNSGYISNNGNPANCDDIDECSDDNGGCQQMCGNTDGSYLCSCSANFTLSIDGHNCTDVDECADNNGGCSDGCVNVDGSFSCTCPDGYRIGQDRVTCEDVDECTIEPPYCSQVCTNSNGSFTCSCNTGYSVNNADFSLCDDIDECSSGNEGCSDGCNNTDGSFVCTCPGGYILGQDSLTCEDVDECSVSNAGCSHSCNNTDGSFLCVCPIGYQIGTNGLTCNDIDECSSGNGGCSGGCNNNDGSFVCSCLSGYILGQDSLTCEDIDECEDSNAGCSDICSNTVGGFECSCPQRYILRSNSLTCEEEPVSVANEVPTSAESDNSVVIILGLQLKEYTRPFERALFTQIAASVNQYCSTTASRCITIANTAQAASSRRKRAVTSITTDDIKRVDGFPKADANGLTETAVYVDTDTGIVEYTALDNSLTAEDLQRIGENLNITVLRTPSDTSDNSQLEAGMIGAIVGGVVAFFVLLVAFLALGIGMRRRYKRRQDLIHASSRVPKWGPHIVIPSSKSRYATMSDHSSSGSGRSSLPPVRENLRRNYGGKDFPQGAHRRYF